MLTVKEVLTKCGEQWRWLANNPQKDKQDYFIGQNIPISPNHSCYCCEYHMERTGSNRWDIMPCCEINDVENETFQKNIDLCPLKDLWPNGCLHHDSPYAAWEKGNDKEDEELKADSATIIADFCDTELQRLS